MALGLSAEDTLQWGLDGRRIAFSLERRIISEGLGATPTKTNTPWDAEDGDNKYEIRSVTRGGVYFCPNNQVGSGRRFSEKEFLDKLNELSYYCLADITQFPDVPFWVIPVEVVLNWWIEGRLGKNSKITKKKALKLLAEI
jgi:hypothetical protein